MFTVPKLRPEWGKGAIGEDGQVTILDLPKAHGIPNMEVITLQPLLLFSKCHDTHIAKHFAAFSL